MKVLIVCSGNKSRGAFNFELDQPFIYEQTKSLEVYGIEFGLFLIKGRGIRGYLKNLFKLNEVISREKYDVIHAHNGPSGFISIFQKKTPVIITFHGSDINQIETRLLSNFVSLLASFRIFVSPKLYHKLIIKPKKDFEIVPCGINLESFFPIEKKLARLKMSLSEGKAYVLFSSHFSNPVKNYKLAKDAMSFLQDAELLEIKNRSREEVNLLLNAADVLLLTSPFEGSPQIIKEAMACNCPIVSTDAGDVKSIINNTSGCYICPMDPIQIAEKLKQLITVPLKTKGRETIVSFDNRLISHKLLNIYKKFGIVVNYQRCTRGLWDSSVPGIRFNEKGVSNYCNLHENLERAFVRGNEGERMWELKLKKIKKQGLGKRYDCIIGVSGGTDSSYLLHQAIKWGLKPLAVNLDNGWSSDISLKNIKKVTSALNIDLETYVINYEEVKDVLRSHMLAGLPWIDAPTDYAIMSVLYKIAKRERIKFILNGADFRSEGKQPSEWTYTDRRQILYVHKKFGKTKLKSYPIISLVELLYTGYFLNIKNISPYNYIDYQKKEAQKVLRELYDWEYYGGHHHENIFTKFAIGYWLPLKFSIDKRKITLSAQIISGEITRDEGLELLIKPSYNLSTIEEELAYVIKKLNFSEKEFEEIWKSDNKTFEDYPSNYFMIKRFAKLLNPIVNIIFTQKPKIFFEMIERDL